MAWVTCITQALEDMIMAWELFVALWNKEFM
jgi:hypothetical protein